MVVVHALAVAVGIVIVLATGLSALRTVVVPRGEVVILTDVVFSATRRLFDLRANRQATYDERDRTMARYGPVSLLVLPAVWVVLVIGAGTLVFWGLGIDSWKLALETSGSSFTTLGFYRPPDLPTVLVAVGEAATGLALVAMLISYLPSIYASFERRELLVALLEVRAGDPPSAVRLIIRHHAIGRLEQTNELFTDWERWFADIEETHTSQPALAFFRSPLPGRSWITAAGALLDSAALLLSTIDTPHQPEPQLCIRSGFLSLRRIADFFGIPHDDDPAPTDPITVDRSEFDEACRTLAAAGVPLRDDLDDAWRNFAGWRVNYDRVLVSLAGFLMAPLAPWSSDRSVFYRQRSLLPRPKMRLPSRLRHRRAATSVGPPD
jgi:hypothetical protein